MKVLVVHDRPDALIEIMDVLLTGGIPETNIATAEDASRARAQLAAALFDLAIIDLTIPTVKGRSDATYSAADDLFVEMFYGDNIYNVPGDIIGITREPEALARINVSIGPHLMAVVEETEDDTWKGLLADRVAYTQRSTDSRLRSMISRYDYDAAIITALDKELSPFRDVFSFRPHPYFSGAEEFNFTDAKGGVRRGIAFSVGAAGQAACSAYAQAIIARFRPKLFLMSGFCGGFKEKTSPGLVMFFQTVFDWDSGKWDDVNGAPEDARGPPQTSAEGAGVEPVFLPRAEPITLRQTQVMRVARALKEHGLSEHVKVQRHAQALSAGRISGIDFDIVTAASGSAVIGHSDVLSRIRHQNDRIVAVDMESYGFYLSGRIAPGAKPETLCIKAVADFCDGEKNDVLHPACCYLAAKTVEEILLKHWDFGEADL